MKTLLLVLVILTSTRSNLVSAADYNDLVLQAIAEMPQGGTYKISKAASSAITQAIGSDDSGHLKVSVNPDAPSYCSGATYLVFMKTLEKLQNNGKISMRPKTIQALGTSPAGSWLPDGHGIWGRWNANGPGTAGVFSDLGIGYNFSDDSFANAKPGDFMKVFWGQDVGKNEAGHSVIFTGVIPLGASGDKVEQVCFWSSNTNMGFGKKCVPRTKIKNVIFSRLTTPENINDGSAHLKQINTYLSTLLAKDSNIGEARNETSTVSVPRSGTGTLPNHH
ncbi:MAG: hypothetical protein ABIR96_09610 [Bdellovibrionota bacterium]